MKNYGMAIAPPNLDIAVQLSKSLNYNYCRSKASVLSFDPETSFFSHNGARRIN